jgi:predicted metal-dependent hydrolase
VEFAALDPSKPIDWCDDDPVLTEFFHALSITFPAGETFFIDSVLHYAPVIKAKHPKLFADVDMFFKQEAAHTFVHEKWNERIEAEFGHPMDDIDAEIEEKLQGVRKGMSPINQLAVTACLEHFTAGLGHLLIGSPQGQELLTKFKEPQRSMWMWHAVEEIEHKKVAYDTYQAMNGGFIRRAIVMLFVSPIFLGRIVDLTLKFCRARGLGTMSSLWHLVKFLLWSPGILARFIPHWLLWFKPSYHPAEHDKTDHPAMYKCAALLDQSKEDGVLVFGPNERHALSIERVDDADAVPPKENLMKQHIQHAAVSAKL